MQKFNLKQIALMFGLLLSAVWCGANVTNSMDGISHIFIKEGNLQGVPKGSSIQASINGHTLSVTFTENLGQVAVAVTTASGGTVEVLQALTPTGLIIYIPLAGDYIVTFTLPNGDEYYGEFTVTD